MATIALPLADAGSAAPGGTHTPAPVRIDASIIAALSARLRRRDASAVDELYGLVGRRAFGLAYRVLGDGDMAEDAVQDAFLELWRQSDRVDPKRGRVDSLLLTLVHRRAIDILRSRARRDSRSAAFPDNATDPVDHRAADLFDAVADSMTHERVVSCMRSLPPEQRKAIELAYFDGLTHREIAERTGAPMGTVKGRLRLGLLRLRSDFGIGGSS